MSALLADAAVCYCLYLALLAPRWRNLPGRPFLRRCVFFWYLTALLLLTLSPVVTALPHLGSFPYRPMNLSLFRDLRLGYGDAGRQLLLNILLFAPFGFLLPQGRRETLWRAGLWSLGLSLAIELLQPALSPWRRSDCTDVFANTLGGILGGCAGQIRRLEKMD